MKEYQKELLGFTAGNFDLLHPGYINCFKDAKNYCDKFIVFLQIDPSLHRKSKYKPVVPVYDRYKALKAIRYILTTSLEYNETKIKIKINIKEKNYDTL